MRVAHSQEEHVLKQDHETRVPSVERAFDLLELLAISDHGLTLAEISRALMVPMSSAYYIVQSLERRGYLSRDPSNREYFLGLSVAAIPRPARAELLLKSVSRPYLQRLSADLNLSVQLGVLKCSEAAILECINTLLPHAREFCAGRHIELHCTALGKALILNLSGMELLKIFQSPTLPGHNQKTLSTLMALEANLKKARINGYTVDNEENQLGSVSIAAPVCRRTSTLPIAAICVSGPACKIRDWRIAAMGTRVVQVAGEIARDLSEFPAAPIELNFGMPTSNTDSVPLRS